jgi:hypothetical protein
MKYAIQATHEDWNGSRYTEQDLFETEEEARAEIVKMTEYFIRNGVEVDYVSDYELNAGGSTYRIVEI